MDYRYQAFLDCPACRKQTRHLYYGPGIAPAGWRCQECQRASEFGEALSDIAKSACKRMEKRKDAI